MTPSPAPPPGLRLSPRFCRCGRELVRDDKHESIDVFTGDPIISHDLVCPRSRPQWRNLWLGGPTHDAWWGDEHGIIGRYEWR